MIYQYDQALQLPTVDLYDTLIMAMALQAAKDMYDKGELLIKDFLKAYGDFMTPITSDQDWYNQNVTGKVRDVINNIYARGGDPLRNAQDRALISMLINSMPYGEIAKKKERAKNAEEYYKNMAALRLNDKYNEDFSKFLGEDPSQWADNFMGVTSPTAFKTLKEATNDWYNNRTPRDLTPEEKLKLGLDPRYNYSGYFDSDLLNVAKGQTPGWQGTPISAFYRDLAYKQLQAMGVDKPTADQVETMLLRNIANAQQEWLVGPKKEKADEFEVMKQSFRNQLALLKDLQQFLKDMAELAAKDKLEQIRAREEAKRQNNSGKGDVNSLNYSLTESIHHDLLFQGLRNSGIPIIKLTTDRNGNLIPEKDESGKIKYINPELASWNELEYTANHNNDYLYSLQGFFKEYTKKYADKPEKVERMMKNRYGSRITGIQLASMLKRQVQKDGGIILSTAEAEKLRGTKGITSDAIGSTYNLTYNDKLAEISDKIKSEINKDGFVGDVQIKFNLTDNGNNAVQISERYNKNRTEVYVNGTVTVLGKDADGKPKSKEISTNAWLPIGLNSERFVGNRSNLGLSSANLSAYGSIDANYMKNMGQQLKSNIGLWANSGMPMMIDPNNIDIEDLYELMQNNL